MNGIVIIGGSVEAYRLARQVPGATVLLDAAERVARRWPAADRVRVGPVDAEALRHAGARLVVEAAHPCDADTARRVSNAARALGVPCLQLVRPQWKPGRRDQWVRLRQVREATEVIPNGARVLVTTGRETLPGLKALQAHVLMRRIGTKVEPFPLKRGRFLNGEGPFTEQQELCLLRRERIDWLLVHNAGGTGGWPKLAAARRLRVPVAMLDRPHRPDGPRVETVTEAVRWLKTRTP